MSQWNDNQKKAGEKWDELKDKAARENNRLDQRIRAVDNNKAKYWAINIGIFVAGVVVGALFF